MPSSPAGDAPASVLLRMQGIGKAFPGVQALQDVSFTVTAGKVAALLGENGAGKSTLINVLSGVFADYAGTIEMNGEPVSVHSPADAQRLGIATIHQELNLVPDMSIADNIWLGRELRTRLGTVDKRASVERSRELLARVGLRTDPRRLVRRCRVAEQQLIEVAKALSLDAKVLIMDEPTSALADAEVTRLFEVIRTLTSDGVGIIYISHRLEELEAIADTVTVLRDGRGIDTVRMADASRDDLIRMMVGRSVEDLPRRTPDDEPGEVPRLRVRGLTLEPDSRTGRVGLRGIDLDVHPGEVVGLAGLMGAGRTETLESIFGAYPASMVGGELELNGQPYRPHSPKDAIDHGVVLVAEDRKGSSLVLGASVKMNASLSALPKYATLGWVSNAKETDAVGKQVRALGVKTPGLTTAVGTLSGGNQQKVVLAKCLLADPGVILLDEPTRGIDVGAKAEIYELVNKLADDGAAVLVASSELPELLRMSDRIIVLCEGRKTAELDGATADQEQILSAAMTRSSVVAAAGESRTEVPA